MTSKQTLTILTAADVDQVLSNLDLGRAISSQAAVFKAFSRTSTPSASSSSFPVPTSAEKGDPPPIQNPHRTTIESPHATSLFMPARVAELGVTTCKIVSVPQTAGSGSGGLPAVTAVFDEMGRIQGMVNARRLTAMRNACGSALFLRLCPLPLPPTSLAIFGSGEQAYAHASVIMRSYKSIKRCTFVVRQETERMQKLVQRLRAEHTDVEINYIVFRVSPDTDFSDSTVPSLELLHQIVSTAQIIVTATSSQTALFPTSFLGLSVRVVLIGSYKPHMHEVDGALFGRTRRVIVDSKEACLREAGELISAKLSEGDLEELGAIDEEMPETRGDDVVVFKSVGLGVQDVAIAKLVLDEAIQLGIGTSLPDFD